MQIELLADHLDLVPVVARWHYNEWRLDDSPDSFKHWIDRIAARTNRDRIPITYIAFLDDTPAGTAMIIKNDMDIHPELMPWLGGVYVIPELRRQGVASALVSHAHNEARRLGIKTLYLYTNGAEPVYEQLGWKTMSREEYNGRTVTVMEIHL
jgi:GNAT superfamily N-acetyltransferase